MWEGMLVVIMLLEEADELAMPIGLREATTMVVADKQSPQEVERVAILPKLEASGGGVTNSVSKRRV